MAAELQKLESAHNKLKIENQQQQMLIDKLEMKNKQSGLAVVAQNLRLKSLESFKVDTQTKVAAIDDLKAKLTNLTKIVNSCGCGSGRPNSKYRRALSLKF